MIDLLQITFQDLLNPQFYIDHGGLWLILFIVFAETGLFAGFFLPGDSLLFVAGIYSSELAAELYSTGNESLDLLLIMSLIASSGIAGNWVGYWFGAVDLICLNERTPSFSRKNTSILRKSSTINMVEVQSYLPVFCQ